MSYEQIIEELKRLKSHNNILPSEQQAEVDANINIEVDEINATIEDYNEKISALEAKIADESNYQYDGENEERDLTIELLEESFENQLEVIDREDEEYKSLQDLATSVFTDYNLEIATLNNEIAAIERRLRKNDIAVSKNIGIRLTEDELFNLNLDLEYKKARIQECEEMKAKYVEDLSNYGELITANNRKREVVLSKQASLNKIKEHRASKVGSIDNAKLRNDKDELASLKAGVAALISRKEYITYNPNAEIDKLIEAIKQNKVQENELVEENKDLGVGVVAPSTDEVKAEEVVENNIEEPIEDKAQTLVSAYLDGNEDLLDKSEKEVEEEALGIPEETTAHDIWLAGNPDLDLEREAEIEEASEILKEKKKDGWFKKNWKKWVAAGLATIALIVALKSCDPNTNQNKPEEIISEDTSHSQIDEDIENNKEKEFNDKYEIPGSNDLDGESNSITVGNDLSGESNDITVDNDLGGESNDITEDNDLGGENNDVIEDTTLDQTVKTGEAELKAGESMISVEDLLNGDINEDTVIEHGDEVGKATDNAELKDYTEEGNAVVEYEKSQEKPSTSTNREDIIKKLEEFMGGDMTFTDEGNQWLDKISGKTR